MTYVQFSSNLLEAADPYGLANLRSFSALPNFDAATIFIDLVIFCIFLIDFSRRETIVRINEALHYVTLQ